jgi:membrane-bound lytic murein transglycosylase F
MRSVPSFFPPDRSRAYHCRHFLPAVMILLLFFLIPGGCSRPEEKQEKLGKLDAILQNGEMVVLTRNAPTTYYFGPDGETGYEYDLVSAYAEYLGVDIRFETRGTVEEVLQALAAGEGDVAAAGLTLTETRQKDFLFGPPYFQVQQQLVCRRGGNIPRSIENIGEVSIEVTAASSYVDRLKELSEEFPDLDWQAMELSTEQVLERVWQGAVDCAVADSNIVSLNRRYMPELVVAFPVAEIEELAWALPADAHDLKQSMEEWFGSVDELLSTILYGRYYAHVEIFDYVDTARFKRRIQKRLPYYRDIFEEAGEIYNIDWKLLAAMAYQESHWDPLARSPTGVRGMMMLTLRTAGQLGIDDRVDIRESIMGGARYFNDLRGRLPEEIVEPDRTWVAMAAYNVGMGHIYDARKVARELDKDPNLWVEFREVLPLLSQPQYYEDLRYGYARGTEPVRYVRRIRNYYDILNNELNNTLNALSEG